MNKLTTLISTSSSPEKAANILARKIIEQTESVIQKKNSCIWAVSGGSSIHKLYTALLCYEEKIKHWSDKLTVLWVDERLVPHSHKDSNYGNAFRFFWHRFETKLLAVPYHQDKEEAQQDYDQLLKQNAIERIDITILGMGGDGHTASLFPGNRALDVQDKNVVAVQDPSVEQARISLTFPFINSSESIFLYFYGTEKAETFRKANLSGDIRSYPILGIDPSKLQIFTDKHLSIGNE